MIQEMRGATHQNEQFKSLILLKLLLLKLVVFLLQTLQ